MIFKINDKYWAQTEQYLQSQYPKSSYSYSQHPTDSTILLQLNSSANQMPNICHTIATKLLSEYNSTLRDKKWNTISEYLQSVLQIFSNTGVVDVQNQYQCQYLNYLLLAADYQQLKLRIWAKKAVLEKAAQGVKVEFGDFSEAVKEEEDKLAEGVRNVDLRLKIIQTQRPQCNQELERVKNLLKNGVWGLRSQLQQKIEKIRHLQKEIKEAKQVSKIS